MSSKKKRPSAHKTSVPAASIAAQPEKNFLFFPVVLALAVIPLIVHLVIVTPDQTEAGLFSLVNYGDFFSQAKATAVIIFTLFIGCIAVACRKRLFQNHNRLMLAYLAAGGIFLLFSLLSALCSKYPAVAFWGAHDRAEGFITLFCYIVIFFYTAYAFHGERDGRNILIALGIVTGITAFLGIFQYTGHDLINTALGKALVVSPWDSDRVKSLQLTLGKGTLYGTFFHYDYVGSFAAMTVPLFLVMAVAEKEKRQKYFLAGAALLAVWLLVGSTSRAGVVGTIMAALFGIVFFARVLAAKWKQTLACVAVLIAAAMCLNFGSKGKLFERVPSLAADAASVFQSAKNPDYLSQLPVKSISSQGETITVVTQKGDKMSASLDNRSLLLKDGSGKKVSVETEGGKSTITDTRFSRFNFKVVPMRQKQATGLAVMIDEQPQFYFRADSGKLQMTNVSGTWDVSSLATPPSYGFAGKEKLGSSRGYIWSRANAMVPGCLLLGLGPDTFAMNFPQNDLLGKYWAYGTTNMVVDKPHDLYLQTLLNNGGIAFLAFVAIILLYLVDSIRLYALKKEYTQPKAFGAAISLAVVGYLFAGLFNDSVVSIAPVFWILFGTGIAVNFRNRKTMASDVLQGVS